MNPNLSNFYKISPEKQKSVINAGFLCFGQNGYQKASVADIAQAAGVSKASIFQYFGNKKELYLFLYNFAGREVSARISGGTEDYFECAEMYVRSLAELSEDYPNLFDFLVLQAQRRDFSEVEGLLEVAEDVCEFNASTLYDKVNWDRFKPGFDRETVQNLFNWLSCGCIAQFSQTMPPKQVYEAMLKYLHLLKAVMYKEN